MFLLTPACRHALSTLANLSALAGDALVLSTRLATELGLPHSAARRVLLPLTLAGVLAAVRGARGGYRLARPADRISLLEVVEAVGGKVQGLAPLVRGLSRPAGEFDARLEAA